MQIHALARATNFVILTFDAALCASLRTALAQALREWMKFAGP
jgi:hypothetical protein